MNKLVYYYDEAGNYVGEGYTTLDPVASRSTGMDIYFNIPNTTYKKPPDKSYIFNKSINNWIKRVEVHDTIIEKVGDLVPKKLPISMLIPSEYYELIDYIDFNDESKLNIPILVYNLCDCLIIIDGHHRYFKRLISGMRSILCYDVTNYKSLDINIIKSYPPLKRLYSFGTNAFKYKAMYECTDKELLEHYLKKKEEFDEKFIDLKSEYYKLIEETN